MRILGAILVAVGLAVVLSVVPTPALAQGSSATTYWLHIDNPVAYWVNDVQDDPEAGGTTGGYNPLGFVIGDEPSVASWEIPFQPTLAAPVALDPAGQMVSTIYIGGNNAAGRVTVTSELRLGSTVLATATASEATVYSAGYQKVELTAPLQGAVLDPSVGDPTWVILAEGAGAQIFLSATTDRWTQFTLPIVGGAVDVPDIRHHNLTGEIATLSLEPSEPSNATHIYHWTTTLTSLELTLSGDRRAGTVTIEVRDGSNATVHSGTFTGNASQADVTGTAGNWTIEMSLDGFAGNLTAMLGAPGAVTTGSSNTASGTSSPGTQASGSATDGPIGNGTGNGTSGGGGKGAPNLALPMLVGAIGVVAVLRRRRL